MRYAFVVLLLVSAALVGIASAGNDYLWGEIGPNDYYIAKDKVKKAFFVGISVDKKYVFKQKDLDALTITAIKITDKRKSDGATAVLENGGPGSKGATIQFKSVKGKGIEDLVEIWGR